MKKEIKPIIITCDAKSRAHAAAVLDLYDGMITKKQSAAAVEKYLAPDYIQHNPLIPTSAKSLGEFFGEAIKVHNKLHVEVYRVIAVGDYVFAHVNFVNLFGEDPNDRGIAGVDIYRFDANGKMAEHWDVLQPVPDPATSANANGMF
jgi:predicted SnoaL-like aldol condensation-catalyzing enzyme